MKLVRFGERGAEKPGVLDAAGRLRSLEGVVADWGGLFLADEWLAHTALTAGALARAVQP